MPTHLAPVLVSGTAVLVVEHDGVGVLVPLPPVERSGVAVMILEHHSLGEVVGPPPVPPEPPSGGFFGVEQVLLPIREHGVLIIRLRHRGDHRRRVRVVPDVIRVARHPVREVKE